MFENNDYLNYKCFLRYTTLFILQPQNIEKKKMLIQIINITYKNIRNMYQILHLYYTSVNQQDFFQATALAKTLTF